MNRKILSDSSCDIFSLSGADFTSVPLHIITNEQDYADTPALNVSDMVDALKHYKGRTSTSCPNAAAWEEAFGSSDEVFAVTITGALSGSYNAACSAKEQYESAHPDRHVHVIDSLSTGPELVLLLEKLQELCASPLRFEEIRAQITAYQEHTHLLFVLSSVRNLANNGRASRLEAKAVGLLGIRIVGQASPEGKLDVLEKSRGEEAALMKVVLQMKKNGWDGGRVILTHCMNPKGALKLQQALHEIAPSCDISILTTGALCSFYAEEGGLLIGYEG